MVMAIIPAHMMRSSAGEYDNEAVAAPWQKGPRHLLRSLRWPVFVPPSGCRPLEAHLKWMSQVVSCGAHSELVALGRSRWCRATVTWRPSAIGLAYFTAARGLLRDHDLYDWK